MTTTEFHQVQLQITVVTSTISPNSRQVQVENWGIENQRKIQGASVLVLGSGTLGQMTLGCLSALGVGNLMIMDNARSSRRDKDFMFPRIPYEGVRKIGRIESIASRINPSIDVRGIHSKFSPSLLSFLNFNPDFIVDTQNNPSQKEHVLHYAMQKKKTFLSSFCAEYKIITTRLNRGNISDLLNPGGITPDSQQGPIPSGVGAGIITDEIRKSLFRINEEEELLESQFTYNLESPSRVSPQSQDRINYRSIRGTRILIAGAGAIGNFAAISLALEGFRNTTVLDFDRVEDHNLERQILFYDKVGDEKADALASRMSEMGVIRARALNKRITPGSKSLIEREKYEILIGCFDNQNARCELSDIALELNIPYIDGGTSATMGSISSYIPKKTGCVKCKKNLRPIKETASCPMALPSVVIPNAIIGSLMVGEVYSVLSGNPPNKRVVYDGSEQDRLYLSNESSPKSTCPCFTQIPKNDIHRN